MKNYSKFLESEETLDNPDWEVMRNLGKKMVDDAIDYLQHISQKPVWQPIPQKSKEFYKEPLPIRGAPITEIYQQFCQHIFPYHSSNIHPRFSSWVLGSGTLTGAFADFLASTMNPNVTIGEHSAIYIDAQIIEWSKQMLGFPSDASGILLSGGSMANITALLVARNSFNNSIRQKGVADLATKMVFYASEQTHSSLQKAAEIIGLGADSLRKIAVDENYQIKISELEKAIQDDLKQALAPFCIIANCGTVNTGAIDDLDAIQQLCQKYNLWFHIDGAFGAAAKLADDYQAKLKAIEKADSIAFDFHKWFYVNYEVGCLLVRDAKKHHDAFAMNPHYLLAHDRGLASGPKSINNYGMELSRGFKALKIWMSLKENGIKNYKKLITQNIAQAFYLSALIQKEKILELMAKTSLNIVCYRFNSGKLSAAQLNDLNKELLMRLHERAIATPSYTILNGNYVIRVAITNHRSKKEDFEILVRESVRIGKEILEIRN